jgi:hypothetical protein
MLPFLTKVPIYAIHVLSASATGSPTLAPPSNGQVVENFLRASVSPVRLLSSISRSTESIIRISAGIRSPVENLTRSPGTSSFAKTCIVLASLLTLVLDVQWLGQQCNEIYNPPNDMTMMRNQLVQSF